jgi:hypothetical protein
MRRMDIKRIVVSLLDGIAFGKFLLSSVPLRILQVGESVKLGLHLILTDSQPILNPQESSFVVLYNCSFIV